MNVNDITDAQLETILRFRRDFPDVKVWPGAWFGIVLLHTQSAGLRRVSNLHEDGTTSKPWTLGEPAGTARPVKNPDTVVAPVEQVSGRLGRDAEGELAFTHTDGTPADDWPALEGEHAS